MKRLVYPEGDLKWGYEYGVGSFAFSPDGKLLATTGIANKVEKSTRYYYLLPPVLWDVATGKEIRAMKTESYGLDVVFSPDGKILAIASPDYLYVKHPRVTLIDVATGEEVQSIAHDDGYASLITFSPDGKMIATSNGKEVCLWDTSLFKIAEFFKKDEFETTNEYVQRVKGVKFPYSTKITLGRYDADRGGFEIEVQGIKAFFPIEREKAKEIAKNRDRVYISGNLVYAGENKLELVDAQLIFDSTNEQ